MGFIFSSRYKNNFLCYNCWFIHHSWDIRVQTLTWGDIPVPGRPVHNSPCKHPLRQGILFFHKYRNCLSVLLLMVSLHNQLYQIMHSFYLYNLTYSSLLSRTKGLLSIEVLAFVREKDDPTSNTICTLQTSDWHPNGQDVRLTLQWSLSDVSVHSMYIVLHGSSL